MSDDRSPEQRASSGEVRRWVFWGLFLIGAFFLITEHRAHVYQYLPFLLLLGCVLMHVFGHGGHGGGHGSGPKPDAESGRTEVPAKRPDSGSTHHH